MKKSAGFVIGWLIAGHDELKVLVNMLRRLHTVEDH